MRKIVTLLGVLAAMLLVTGVAEANPDDYPVTGKCSLEDSTNGPVIIPHIEDDVAEVRERPRPAFPQVGGRSTGCGG